MNALYLRFLRSRVLTPTILLLAVACIVLEPALANELGTAPLSFEAGSKNQEDVVTAQDIDLLISELEAELEKNRGENPSIIESRLAMVLSMRRYRYNDGLLGGLRNFEVLGLPAALLQARIYPFSFRYSGALRQLGAVISFQQSKIFSSTLKEENGPDSFDLRGLERSYERSYELGLAYRSIFRWGQLDAQASFINHTFSFAGTNDAALRSQLPAVDYEAIRVGGRLRLPLHPRFVLNSGAFARFITHAGAVGDRYFPRSERMGLDGDIGFDIALAYALSASMRFQYIHYFYSMNAIPGDRYVAGGALDQYGALSLGVSHRW